MNLAITLGSFCAGLMWGSFLNSLAYRLINLEYLSRKRSLCPHCKHALQWRDLIPVISYLLLRHRCRYCAQPISLLYPAIELLTGIAWAGIACMVPMREWFAAILFSSALVVAVRTDIEYLLISRFTSLFLVPVGWLLAWYGLLPISLLHSMLASVGSFVLLWLIAQLYKRVTGNDGLGIGDADLLALIGAFTGALGAWFSLSAGSFIALFCTLSYMTYHRNFDRMLKIPFGPFLALAALIYLIYQQPLLQKCMLLLIV